MDIRTSKLHPSQFYHIFNRGINGCEVFFEEKNYAFFLQRYAKYVSPFADTYAYCLLNNHFHLLIQVKSEEELLSAISARTDQPLYWFVSNAFSSFIQSYTRAMNKVYSRTGPLFENPFKRIEVCDDHYFTALIAYIHRNPMKHGLTEDFKKYVHSSYRTQLSNAPTKLKRQEVLNWFGGKNEYIAFHEIDKGQPLNSAWMLE
jgi:REP element-mobilizing transposase RayT